MFERSTELGGSIISLLKFNLPSTWACNSEVTDPIRPEFELVRDFMPVLVISKFDEDMIKNERASLETPFFHYKSMGNFFKRSRALNSVGSGPIWPKLEFIRDFMPVLVTCKFEKKSDKKQQRKDGDIVFPIIS